MNTRRIVSIIFFILISAIILTACAAPTTESLKATAAPAQAATSAPTFRPTQAPAATSAPQPTATRIIPLPTLAPTTITEKRIIELEYPAQMRLGDSDIIRIALIPSKDGFTVTTEFPDHQVVTDTVTVARPGGYDLFAVARLDAIGFDLSPQAEQTQVVNPEDRVTWRWSLTPRSAGQQRLSISIKLQWRPQPNNPNPIRETTIYSKGLTVQVTSFFGLTARQAAMMGMIGLGIGLTFSLPLAASLLRPRRKTLQSLIPNLSLTIEHNPAIELSSSDATLLRALFQRYKRITLEKEFRSGYSGARTFLILPIRNDNRADAYTIAKIGERDSIQREYENYERHVKDSLPPMTARIQNVPVTTRDSRLAAVRYTFIAEPDVMPTSLRETLLANPDPPLLEKIFSTFGPGWWMQRKPHTFKLAQEYDRLLPAHYVLEPAQRTATQTLNRDSRLEIGDLVRLKNMRVVERRADGKSLSLIGAPTPGMPPMRARWMSLNSPDNASATIVATRESLLQDYVAGFDLFGLPDPFLKLPSLLDERIIGTQSTIHGDLNLENVLVGPGGFVWLIDFAQTRDGHPLFDFAHLEAEIIAHVIAPQVSSEQWAVISKQFFANGEPQSTFRNPQSGNLLSLISTLHSIASRCLFNPAHPREYQLALFMACLGSLKYTNLNAHQKHLLYLTAAQIAQTL
ncbi:MAG: phosphotransferase [Chloroflexi bacterium]|nr:phosphotransferase [Chloroflexota bacterium]